MARIFISYSRADRQFVDEFVPLLRKVYGNDSVWFDADIPGGHQWWHLILSEIARCDLFIFLLSNEALASAYCQAEFREGLRLRKLFLPVIVRPKTQINDTLPDELRDALKKTQYVDFARGIKDYQAITDLYAAVNRLLAQVPAVAPAPLVSQPTGEPPVVVPRQNLRRLTKPWTIILAVVVSAIFIIVALNRWNDDRAETDLRLTSAALPTQAEPVTPFPTAPAGVTSSATTPPDTPLNPIVFETFPDGRPTIANSFLNGDEYASLGILLEGSPEDDYCTDGTDVAILNHPRFGNFLTTVARARGMDTCNTVPVQITFNQAVTQVTIVFWGARDAYLLKAYDRSGNIVATASELGKLHDERQAVTVESDTRDIVRVRFGLVRAITGVLEIQTR